MNFSILIYWELETEEHVLEYILTINNTTQSTNKTSLVTEGEYNIPIEMSISAINCAGKSAVVTEDIYVGMLSIYHA